MGTNSVALPAGFELDQPSGLPEGFVLDSAQPEPSIIDSLKRGAIATGKNIAAGAADIGATVLLPFDYFGLSGYTPEQRRQSINEFAGDSGVGKTARILTNIAGTAGVGGTLAKGATAASRFAPQVAPMIARSLETGGMSTGAPAARAFSMEGTRNAAIRVGGGAVSGAAMGGMINPEDTGMGAVIGGAIPVAGKIGGKSGELLKEWVIDPLFKPSNSAMLQLVKDAGGVEQAKAAIQKSIEAGKTLSGESYTLGQGGKNWGLAATERARSAVQPENYQRIYQAQRDARIAELQKIAGGSDDVARAEALDALKASRAGAVEDLYGGMQETPFTLGKEGEKLMTRARPYGALTHAEKLATTQGRKFSIPVTEEVATTSQSMDDIARMNAARQTYPDVTVGGVPSDMPIEQSKDLLSEIRKLGGVSMRDAKDLIGERQITRMGVQGGVFTTKGEQVGDMVRRLVDRGVMPPQVLNDVDGGAQALRDAIQNAASGSDDGMRAAAEAYYGTEVLPGAFKEGVSAAPQQIPHEVVDRIVMGGDLQSVKQGIDQVLSSAEGPQKRALMQLKTDYLKFMESKSPEYIKANNIFADKSKPITQMAVAQRMLDVLTGEAAKHGGEAKQASAAFLQAYRNAPLTARSVSGMKQPIEKIFTPQNLEKVRKIAREVAAHGDLQTLGKGGGSDTMQKSARAQIANSLADLISSNKIARAGVNLATLGAKNRIGSQLDVLLQNPEYARDVLEEYMKPQKRTLSSLLQNPAVRALPQAAYSR